MKANYLTNVPLEKAKNNYLKVLKENGFAGPKETIKTKEAIGRITAEAIYAAINAPHYPASAMDGIALVASKTFGASETTPAILSKKDYIVVDTGDPIPNGCDAVVMIEDVIEKNGKVYLYKPASPWQHIRQIGEDICQGEMIVPSHTRITASTIGALLAGGIVSLNVIKKPLVGIIPTGDEIVKPSSNPKPGDIIEFNSSIFSGMLKEWNADTKVYPIVKDKPDKIKEAIKKALDACDIVILNAGSSAGRDDYSSKVIAELGEVLFHGISIKPGKPAILGLKKNKPILGVPGYPVSGIIVIEEILKPIIDEWFRDGGKEKDFAKAVLTKPIVSGLKYEEFVRVKLGEVDGKLVASPLNRGAGVVSSFMKADGIVRVPEKTEGFNAGEEIEVELLKPREALKNTLVAIGSHDPLIDELSDMLHSANPKLYLSSTHVGSMGGLMAVKRGETHIAGTHLLDENNGTYNYAFIEKYFPKGGVRLVECVGRTQGIMVQKGNPLNIKTVSDLTKEGLRYVNRQKGSGTRILFDYLCKKDGISAESIYGYDREEFTHSSVATQIANDTADAGMGIYSAAHIYDLDFIPICTETYDLLISDSAWDSPMVKQLLTILKSDEFKERLEKLGGYTLKTPGKVKKHY